MAKKKKFVVLSGGHYEGGVQYKQGETVESEHDLCAKFENKFAPAGSAAAAVAEATKAEADKKAEDEAKAQKAQEEGPKDVTGDFKIAEAAGARVLRVGRAYEVVDAEDGEALADEPLTSKKAVAEFLDTLIDDE